MNKPSPLVPFIIGLVLGILGTIYLPGYVRPYIPDWARGKAVVVKGTVAAKQKKEASLLLTVNTAEGVLLATITRKADEIGLLVNEKDVIEFTLPKYAPLIEDPRITRVLREQPAASAPAAVPVEKGVKDTAPRQGKAPAAVTAPSGTAGKKQPDRK